VNIEVDLDLRLLVERFAAKKTHRLSPLASHDRKGEVALVDVFVAGRSGEGHVTREMSDQDALLVEADITETAGERRRHGRWTRH